MAKRPLISSINLWSLLVIYTMHGLEANTRVVLQFGHGVFMCQSYLG